MTHDPFLAFLIDPAKGTAWATGYVLTGWTISLKNDGWLLVIKVKGKKGKPLVSFIHAHSAEECMRYWFGAMTSNAYHLKWHEDKFTKV